MDFYMRFFMSDLRQGVLEWARVVLDEAQMVESGASGAAKMALKLRTRTRWAVTGTPVTRRRGLDDVYGLLACQFVWAFTMEILICMGFYYGCMETDQRL